MEDTIELKYIGDGTQLGEVPTRDLTQEEVQTYGKDRLLKSGLYVEVGKPKFSSKPTKSVHKSASVEEE